MSLPLQGELDLRLRPVVRPERLFFAVMPDAAAARAIARIGRTLCDADPAAPKPIRQERLHVSAHFVCDWPRLKARRVMAARLAGAAVRLPPFDLALRAAMTFEPFGSRSEAQRPLVLVGEAAGVSELQAALAAARDYAADRTLVFYCLRKNAEMLPFTYMIVHFELQDALVKLRGAGSNAQQNAQLAQAVLANVRFFPTSTDEPALEADCTARDVEQNYYRFQGSFSVPLALRQPFKDLTP